MQLAKHFLFLAVGVVGACASAPSAPGMAVVSSSSGASTPGSMLVAFPKTACTGTDSAVFLDEKGAFVASVAPGTATYLAFPQEAAHLFVVSSKDVNAEPGAWFRRHEITRPAQRADHGKGILVEVPRYDAKNCGGRNATPRPHVVPNERATQASADLTWLEIRPEEGAQWVGQHKARVDELLGPPPADPDATGHPVQTVTNVP
jgi:hypothetical protein